MRAALLLGAWFAALPAWAQLFYPHDLASSRDGSVLYFSALESSASANTRIYRWSPDMGVTLFADRPDLAELPPFRRQHLYGTQLTVTGAVFFHAEAGCATGLGPGFNTCSAGETQAMIPGTEPLRIPGFLLVSPSGRYGVFASFESRAVRVDWVTGEEVAVDLPFQTIANVSPPFTVNQHAVADDGRFLIAGGGRVRVWSPDGETVLPVPDLVRNAILSADGSTVAITTREATDRDAVVPTYVYDLRSGRKTRFAASVVALSDDGQTVAWLDGDPYQPNARTQAMVSRADGSAARRITNVPGGILTLTLSGDGRYLFAASNDPGLLRRYDLTTGAVDEINAAPRP